MRTTCRLGTTEWDGDLPQLLRRLRNLCVDEFDAGFALAALEDVLSGDLGNPKRIFSQVHQLEGHVGDILGVFSTPQAREAMHAYRECTIRFGAPPFLASHAGRLISVIPLFVSDSATVFILVWVPGNAHSPFSWTRFADEDDHAGARSQRLETLSERELEVARWIGEGKTSFEIARILEISEHTVNDYIRSSMRKLNCANRMHLISKTIRLGLLA